MRVHFQIAFVSYTRTCIFKMHFFCFNQKEKKKIKGKERKKKYEKKIKNKRRGEEEEENCMQLYKYSTYIHNEIYPHY